MRFNSSQQSLVCDGGDTTTPAIALDSDTNTGLIWSATGTMGIVGDGNTIATFKRLSSTTYYSEFSGQVGSTQQDLTSSTSISTDCNIANTFRIQLNHTAVTMNNPTNARGGFTYTWIIEQNVASRTITTWGTKFDWPGGTPPTLSTTVNRVDIVTAIYDATNDRFYCTFQANFS